MEDQAPGHGHGDNLEARFAREAVGLKKTGVSYFKVTPCFRAPFGHGHAEQEETYIVIGGSVRLKVDDEIVELGALDAIGVPGEATRAFEGGPGGGGGHRVRRPAHARRRRDDGSRLGDRLSRAADDHPDRRHELA